MELIFREIILSQNASASSQSHFTRKWGRGVVDFFFHYIGAQVKPAKNKNRQGARLQEYILPHNMNENSRLNCIYKTILY